MTTIFIGTTSVAILIPSRRKDGGFIDSETRNEWESKARAELEKAPFGGSSPMRIVGSYVDSDDQRVTREDITVLSSNCGQSALEYAGAKERILGFAGDMCRALGQDSILVRWGEEAILQTAELDLSEVPVVPFATFPTSEQARLLTLGWAGLPSAERALQVLSLDTWTLPDEPREVGADGLALVAVLHERDRKRRAWRWEGSGSLKSALGRLTKSRRLTAGDLIFANDDAGRMQVTAADGYMLLALVTDQGIVGPRELRKSHGQMNPVTRQLLLRILRRQWTELEADLQQKDVAFEFFPKLQQLRQRIGEVAEAAYVAPPPSLPVKRKKGKPAPTPEPTNTRERWAFRQSVLVVGRMMFLRFLAQKGWIPGGVDALVEAYDKHGERYFKDYIQPLWFQVLNTPVAQRSPETKAAFSDAFPYLNGGLFAVRPGELSLDLPTDLFDPKVRGSFLQLYKDYQFSLNEYAGSDDSLAIDPSLFGKVLESFNPDTERKNKGVHYTPKPVAWAMAMEAIFERVSQLTGVSRASLEGVMEGAAPIGTAEALKVQRTLDGLRIIDPAVGSGVLLWAALEVLLALDSACDGILNRAQGYQRGSHRWGIRGRHFVCNCLYGVDISDEAVELARLRLWLAVAMSEDMAQPLPDLDLNICQGDSLLASHATAEDSSPKDAQGELRLDEKVRISEDLAIVYHKYLKAGEEEPELQRQLRAQAVELRRQLSALGGGDDKEDQKLHWQTFFPHVFRDPAKQGFDIVIANPPYIRVQNIAKDVIQAYRQHWPTIAEGNADLSFAFIELALKSLCAPDGGQIAFIQPNFRHHDAGQRVRDLLLGKGPTVFGRLRLWVDFGDHQVFPTASNYVAILFAERTPPLRPMTSFCYSNPEAKSWNDQQTTHWMVPGGERHEHPAEGEWLTIPQSIRNQIQELRSANARRLGDVADIEVGVQTSADKTVFLFKPGEWKDLGNGQVEVLGKDVAPVRLEKQLVRPCVKGSVGTGFALLWPHEDDGELITEARLRKEFPLTWAYLTRKRAVLEAREKGKFKGAGWYRFGRKQGFAACARKKVVVPALQKEPYAVLDGEGVLTFTASGKGGGGAYAVFPKTNSDVTLEQLHAWLTSEAAALQFRACGSSQKGGWFGIDRDVLADLPIP
jgi:hypothetical protein